MTMFSAIVCGHYALASIVLFIAMGVDKRRAIHRKRRTPERTLFVMAVVGGAVGGLFGMQVFRHKTRKPLFYVVFILLLMAHAVLVWWLWRSGALGLF